MELCKQIKVSRPAPRVILRAGCSTWSGLDKLASAEEQVSVMEKELQELQPVLVQTGKKGGREIDGCHSKGYETGISNSDGGLALARTGGLFSN